MRWKPNVTFINKLMHNMSVSKSQLIPALFISHGAGPAAFVNYKGSRFQDLDDSSPSAAFLRSLKDVVNEHSNHQPIRSILVVSAHWEEPVFTVDYEKGTPKLYYDYSGFPEETYAPHLTYPVPTDLNLAVRVHQLLTASSIKTILKPREAGFDHGVFIPLKLAYPEATIPVVQLSLNRNLDLATHIQLGEALAPLRQEGVLIIGSGQITHGGGQGSKPGVIDTRATAFIDYMCNLLEGTNEGNYEEMKRALINTPSDAPHFAWNHPRTEHFVPLAVAFGASKPAVVDGSGDTCGADKLVVRRVFEGIAMGYMALDNYIFSSTGSKRSI